MKNLIKVFTVLILALSVFGGGGAAAYLLFFRKLGIRPSDHNQPVVTPTPDQGLTMFEDARQQLAKGNKAEAIQTLVSLFQSFPKSGKSEEAKRLLGDLNMQRFFSAEPDPDKAEYIVQRGDSIAKIATKMKSSPELIFRANGLDGLTIHIGQKFIIPKGKFSLLINLKRQDVTLLNNGSFFRWYKPQDFRMPPKIGPALFKVHEKIAWVIGTRVAFGGKNYMGSSRWIVLNQNGITLYSETNPQNPNIQKPASGIMLAAPDMEEVFAVIAKDTPVTVQ
jgi:LysM repeat protein